MLTYRNKVTGQEICVPCEVGGDWEPVSDTDGIKPAEKKEPTKKKKSQ